jgi:dTDP-glucose 4,6-dehydratase
MQRFIVTGGLGFIGSNLVKLLLSKKYRVLNIDKISYASNAYNVKEFINNKNYSFIKENINNQKKIIKVLKNFKPHGIFNLAAETHVDRSIDGPKEFFYSNTLGVFNLLEAFRKYYKSFKSTRLIHISTDEVYGDIMKGRSSENWPYKPSSPYAASKASSDHIVYSYVRTYGLPAIITNCSNNYGPRQHPEKLVPKLIYNILNGIDLPIYGKGKNSREWIYVEDHCEALLKVFKKGKVGNFYNIGSNYNLNNLEIVKKILSISKKIYTSKKSVKIKFVKDRPGHDFRYALNSNKIKNQLKWSPKYSFDKGMLKTFLWYFDNQKYFKNFSKKDIVTRLGKND